MGVITVEFPATISVEIFTENDEEALTAARQYLHLAHEEWGEIPLDGNGYTMNIFVDQEAPGKITWREDDDNEEEEEDSTLLVIYSLLLSGEVAPGQLFADADGQQWAFISVNDADEEATFVDPIHHQEMTFSSVELDMADFRLLSGQFAPPTSHVEPLGE